MVGLVELRQLPLQGWLSSSSVGGSTFVSGETFTAQGSLLVKRMRENEMLIDLLFMKFTSKHISFS
jgi:hypothetical protein